MKKFIKIILIAVSLLCAAAGGSYVFSLSGVQGIDVSHHNHVNWMTVSGSTETSFAFVKITEGSTFVDPHGRGNILNAEKAGIPVGAYHYMSNKSPAASQFRNFKHHYVDGAGLVPMVDVEDTDTISYKELNARVKEFCVMIEREYGVKPVIYTKPRMYHWIFKRHGGSFWNDYVFFFWQPIPLHPFFSTGRAKCIWQYSTGRTSLPGTSPIDRDVLSGISVDDLKMTR